MKVLKGVLEEERKRLKSAEASYVREIGKLPKGSVQQKRIKDKEYAYRAYRKGARVVYEYLGKLEVGELKELERKMDLRRRYEEKLREVRENLRNVRRMVRG
ncbi:MAG: hypothetical protein WCU74_04520 [Candidatus Omnitrophota bacterium]|jgi:hypothetical protein